MAGNCKTLKITQIGGFAGHIALPPLIDLERRRLDKAEQKVLDDVCRQLSASAQMTGTQEIGADLGGYLIEISTGEAAPRRFVLPNQSDSATSPMVPDVAHIIAPLLDVGQKSDR